LNFAEAFNSAMAHFREGRLPQAEAEFRGILQSYPNAAAALNGLAIVVFESNRPEEAIQLLRQAIAIEASEPDLHYNLARMCHSAGQVDESIAALEKVIALKPDHVSAINRLGTLQQSKGRLNEATAAFRRAEQLSPQSANIKFNLGNALRAKHDAPAAVEAYRNAIAIDPKLPGAFNNLALALHDMGRPDDAAEALQAGLKIQPDQAYEITNLGNIFKDTGRLDEALALYDRALELDPKHIAAMSNRLFAIHLHPKFTPEDIYREHLRFDELFARPLRGKILPHTNDNNPGRPLRIGLVSPDFRDHVVGRNVLPLLREIDAGNFQTFCYSSVPFPDAMTAKFRSVAHVWRDIASLDDDQAADLIRADRIDILIDLSLHSRENRLMIFARQPAPLQATFAGYPSGTGLRTIQYRLTDPYLDPHGQSDENRYCEQSIRLPHSFWCYDPAAMEVPPLPPENTFPASKNGFVTFGCLTNFAKVNDFALALWAQILARCPDSRMILLAPPGKHRDRVLGKLSIHPTRLEFVSYLPRQGYLATFSRIDLGLDTFPYNGHTTSLDAAWMGVPIISLCGKTAVSRAAFSQASNLGLAQELVAHTPEQYVELALGLAEDHQSLNQLRMTLRQRLMESPLTDARGFARGLEGALRQIWQRWCEKNR
jgi:predicted O-linked N-acetylglucosamine transferase (SPINDLY family)